MVASAARSGRNRPLPEYKYPRGPLGENPFATRSQSPASARATSSAARESASADGLRMSVTCWPTIGLRFESKARTNASTASRTVAGRPLRNALRVRPEHEALAKRRGMHEAEHTVEIAAAVGPESANLVSHEALERWIADRFHKRVEIEEPEFADLRVRVSQMRDLEDLREDLAGRTAVAAEEARPRDAELRVGIRIERVAAVAWHEAIADVAPVPEEEIAPVLLSWRQRVVEVADRDWADTSPAG